MKECAVIGGGIGGCSIAALLNARGHDVTLIEKEPMLGGCASTFHRRGSHYNAGATTVSGYFEGGILKKLFDEVGTVPDLIQSDPAIVILQQGHTIRRTTDMTLFLSDLQDAFPNHSHEQFWELVQQITNAFYTFPNPPYYSNHSFWAKLISLTSFVPMLQEFKTYLFTPAMKVIRTFYPRLDSDYKDFLDAQVMIVAQAHLEEISFFTAAVSLGYTFMPTHYPVGGMGSMCTKLVSQLKEIQTNTSVQTIRKIDNGYQLEGTFGILQAKNIITATSIFDSSSLFADDDIRHYVSSFSSLNNHQSAFVVYMNLSVDTKKFAHHYQIITPTLFPHTLSKAIFISLSESTDLSLSPKKIITLTASVHADSRDWIGLESSVYKEKKESVKLLLEQTVCDTLDIKIEEVLDSFAATPKTFQRYVNRSQLGGNPIKMGLSLFSMPANDSPFTGLYHTGDTVFPAQGWPGVAMGAYNLVRTFRE